MLLDQTTAPCFTPLRQCRPVCYVRTWMISGRLSAALLGHFIGYSTSVRDPTPPTASSAACVENQLLGKHASGVPCAKLCWKRLTFTPATSVSCRCNSANSAHTCAPQYNTHISQERTREQAVVHARYICHLSMQFSKLCAHLRTCAHHKNSTHNNQEARGNRLTSAPATSVNCLCSTLRPLPYPP